MRVEARVVSDPAWEVPAEPGMPTDPRLWTQGGISSTYPAHQAVVATTEMVLTGTLRERA